MTFAMLPYLLAAAIFLIGVYAVVAKKNVIKIIIGLIIIEYATNLMLVLVGYRWGGRAPILDPARAGLTPPPMVDPLPQALVVTSVVIGLGVTVLAAAVAIRIYDRYRTFDVSEIRRLKG